MQNVSIFLYQPWPFQTLVCFDEVLLMPFIIHEEGEREEED